MAPDAVVIGAGPNGLIAANHLADAGWEVLVLEEQAVPGGAVKSAEVTLPGYTHDLFSSFYPLTPASRYIASLELEEQGLRWARSETVVAHPSEDGRCAALHLDLDRTCASLDEFAEGDGDAWRSLFKLWRRAGPHVIGSLLTPMPPVRSPIGMLRALGPRGLTDFARFAILPARRMTAEHFSGEGAGWLIAGNALHADLTPESAAGGMFGWLLCGLGQLHGYPVAEGGSQAVTDALVDRLRANGGEVRCGVAVERIEVRAGRAVAGLSGGGERFEAGKAILADVGAPALYRDMLPAEAVPERVRNSLGSFEYDNSTFKVNWALRGPIPWKAEAARQAGTVHVAEGMDGLSRAASQLVRGEIPDRPFLVLGQYASYDPTRAPDGCEAAWAYTHLPQRITADAKGELDSVEDEGAEAFADRMEEEVERVAPGFRALIEKRHLQTPQGLELADRNLVGGAMNGGTAQLQQQVIFRPVPGLGRPTTGVRGLYLASASAHPGGGLHGGPGGNAARVALRTERLRRPLS